MLRFTKKILPFVLTSAVAVGVGTIVVPTPIAAADAKDYKLAQNCQDGNLLQCFNWTYQQIIDELPNIAEAGFTSVQTSPAQQACTSNSVWYFLYQPNNFAVGNSGLGNENDLKRLCEEAHKYGIKIIVDVVANHLAGDHSNIDWQLKGREYWHNGGNNIDYNNRYQITHYNIGMPDINSEHSFVQQKVKNYIQQLKADGVDGIRWDAAKHISLPSENCGFWSAVIDKSMYNYGEILDKPVCNNDGLANSLMSEYTNYMSVTDSIYSATVTGAFKNGTVPTAYANWATVNGIESDELVYWAESHDTYSNDESEGGWTKNLSENVIDRAYATVAARANSSSLYFSRPSSKSKSQIMVGKKGSTHFASREVAAVNKLHNACIGEKDYYTTGSNCAVVSRESGAVVVLGSGSNKYVSVPNGGGITKPGKYVDQITGNEFNVTSSTISGQVGSSGIAALLQTDAPKPPITKTVDIYFTDNNNWGNVYAYSWGGSATTDKWPGTRMQYVKKNEYGQSVYKIAIPSDSKGLIFNNGNGVQTVDITSNLTNNTGFYLTSNGSKCSVGTYVFK